MSKEEKHITGDENLEAIQNSLGKTEQFIEDNQKSISVIIGVIVLIVVSYFAYQKFYVAPQEKKAQEEVFMAQNYFAQDSFQLALNGDGFNEGFTYIADEYGMTSVGNTANVYAGICYLKLEQYDEAIKYLENFDIDDDIISTMALGAIGDAYVQKDDLDKAVKYFTKASENNKNDFTTPLFLKKLGLVYEKKGQKEEAKEAYETIKKEYPKSNEARKIDEFIARLAF